MYSIKELQQFEYFKDKTIDHLLDSLTGVLNRKTFNEFTNHLIDNKTPFVMAMFDIDNFKHVNDNYGHQTGDECLIQFATKLKEFTGSDGVIGRFGGDEFVAIFFIEPTYQSAYDYIAKIYKGSEVVRKTYCLTNVHLYLTSSSGCVCFPSDGETYEELFSKVDKALYRGKTKGRNCYIVYVHEKHKDINVKLKENKTLTKIFEGLDDVLNMPKESYRSQVNYLVHYAVRQLDIVGGFFIRDDLRVVDNSTGELLHISQKEVDEIKEALFKDRKLFVSLETTNIGEIRKKSSYICDYFTRNNIHSFSAMEVSMDNTTIGYLFLYENRIRRLWQENDVAIMQYIGKLINILYLKRTECNE